MSNFSHRLWIAIAVATLATMSSIPVLAKPQSRSIVVSQIDNKILATDDVSRQPVEAVLANLKPRTSTQSKAVRVSQRQGISGRSTTKVRYSNQVPKSGRQITERQYFQGISHLIGTDRVVVQSNNVSGVDWLVD